jgi:(S)-2-hydroxyglutarate dehydrogenase
MKYDVVIIGGGIVGLGTAYRLMQAKPSLKICVLEKEMAVGLHQTGRNSGVIHSGIYYKPGSLKAINCKLGYDQLLDFAQEHGIRHEVCGKVIVATKESEKTALENIFQRGIANDLKGIRKITTQEVSEIEPHVRSVAGVWVPQTGIVDYPQMTEKLAELVQNGENTIKLGHKVTDISLHNGAVITHTEAGEIESRVVVNCAGLYSDKITKLTNPKADVKIIPFRGEYYELKKEKEFLVKNLIYPVPNPEFPFLGVHFTRMVNGGIEAGPNAVLAFKREGYSRWDLNIPELAETLTYSGFHKIAKKFWRDGMGEMYRSYSKRAFVRALQNLIPEIEYGDLKSGVAGVRAQACDSKGNLLDDFVIMESANIVNVCNAPSPAATACLAIGQTIAEKVLAKL